MLALRAQSGLLGLFYVSISFRACSKLLYANAGKLALPYKSRVLEISQCVVNRTWNVEVGKVTEIANSMRQAGIVLRYLWLRGLPRGAVGVLHQLLNLSSSVSESLLYSM